MLKSEDNGLKWLSSFFDIRTQLDEAGYDL